MAQHMSQQTACFRLYTHVCQTGLFYVAFVTDLFARRVAGWGAGISLNRLVPDALELATHERSAVLPRGLIHHRNRVARLVSIRHTDRLSEARAESSVDGSIIGACPDLSGMS
jgi:transposase InsO family protein